MITKETIEERKSVIAGDTETVRTRLVELEKKKEADIALLNALIGALQQCDAFLKEFDDELSDDGNDKDQLIPSVAFPLGNYAC